MCMYQGTREGKLKYRGKKEFFLKIVFFERKRSWKVMDVKSRNVWM